MSPIRIPITQEEAKTPTRVLLRILLGGFVLGLLVGTIPIQPSFIENAGDFIAGVGEVDVPRESTSSISEITNVGTSPTAEEVAPTVDANDEEETPDPSISEGAVVTPPLVSIPSSLNVRAQEDRITQLSREIVRIKDASVALIAEFNQNCGVWTDECATPYASALEKNNIAYDQVARELEAITSTP